MHTPDGSKTTVTYQNWLPVTRSIIDASGSVITSSTTGYDALRRSVTQTDSRTEASVVTRTDYHTSNGLVIAVKDITPDDSDPNTDPITIRTTNFAYDAMGRRISTTLPDTSTTHTSYTLRGETLATWGSQTYARLYQYDARGRMSELRTYQELAHGTQPTTATTGYASTTWSYNGRNQLIRKEYDDDNGTNYTYTPAGRLKTRQWARGNWTRYDYDVAGALSATLYFTAATTESAVLAATAGNDPLTPDVIVSNDKLGRPTTVTQTNQSTHSYSYDASTLRLTSETIGYDTDADGTVDFSRILDRAVDSLQRPTGWTLKNGTTTEHGVTYGYRANDSRLNTVTSHGQSHTYGYVNSSHSLLHTVTSPSHTVTNTYESSRNVLVNKENKTGSNVRSNYLYTTNAIGQRTDLSASGDSFGTAPIYNWSYNGAGELISANDTSSANNDRAYQYDGIGNRQKSANNLTLPGTANYAVNGLNQYTAVPSLPSALSYDADGNLTSGPLPAHTSGNSTLTWDGENRLISVTVNGVTTTYRYDYQSRRISKQVDTDPTIYYLYDGWNMIVEYTGTTLNKSYTWGMDLSGSMQGAGGVGGLLAVNDGTASYYPTYDGNGNVSEYLDSAGATVAHYEYDAFGNTIVSTGSKVADFAHRFSTKPHDAETGLYYYGYRYYDPVTGRWPSRDPIEEEGGLNLYGFVENNPTSRLDVLGNMPMVLEPAYTPSAEVMVLVTERMRPIKKGGLTTYNFLARITVQEDKECCIEGRLYAYRGPIIEISDKYPAGTEMYNFILSHEKAHVDAINNRMKEINDQMKEEEECYPTKEMAAEIAGNLTILYNLLILRHELEESNHQDSNGYGTPPHG